MTRKLFVALFLLFAVSGLSVAQEEPSPLVPVIVELNIYTRPETDLAGIMSVEMQRTLISSTQRNLLADLASDGITTSNVKTYTIFPVVAMWVPEDEVDDLRSNPRVRSVREDRLSFPTGDLGDELLSVPNTTSGGNVIGASTAWSYGYTGAGYSVAVLDTGVDFDHPALIDKRVDEFCFSTSSYGQVVDVGGGLYSEIISSCPNGSTYQTGTNAAEPYNCPLCSHGTHVAGIAAGTPTGQSGYNGGIGRDSGLIGVSVFSIFTNSTFCGDAGTPCPASYDSDQMLALQRLYQQRSTYALAGKTLAAVNFSLGGGRYNSSCDSSYDPGYLSAVTNLVNANIAVIAATGNEGYTGSISAPSCISNVIAVSATDDYDGVAGFASIANFMNYYAPGVDITAPIPNDGYDTWQGTSMATPMVAGAWAVMRQAYPAYTWSQIRDRLATTGKTISMYGVSRPRINLGAAVPRLTASTYFTGVSSLSAEATTVNVQVTIRVTEGTMPSPQRVNLTYGGTATRDADYTAPTYVDLTRSGGWPVGTYTATGTIPISLLRDRIIDDGETITLTLSSVSYGTIGSPPLQLHTIFVDDINVQATGVLSAPASTITVPEGDIVQIPFNLAVINGPPDVPAFTANLSFGGVAIAGTDYNASSQVVFDHAEYPAGNNTGYLSLQAIDRGPELQGTRTLTITMTSLTQEDGNFVTLGTPTQVTVQIVDIIRAQITENELFTYVNNAIAANPALPFDLVLFDFQATTIVTTVRLDDGTLGTVHITPTMTEGLLGFTYTIQGTPSTALANAINIDLPPLVQAALQPSIDNDLSGVDISTGLIEATLTTGYLQVIFPVD